MNKTVVIAEKPSVGKDIAKVLNCHKKGNGFYEGSAYIVTWAFGHLVTLADPEIYNEKYAQWRLEDLPMLPSPVKLIVIPKTRSQFNQVKAQLQRKDVNEIIIATDAGREGELVARWIIEKSQVKKSVKRLWISSVTNKAISEGFKNLRDGSRYESLFESARARAIADWYVGINASRALTCRFNAQLSCGRVQTPTLAMISKRDEEIQSFTPKPFYGIQMMSNDVYFTYSDSKNHSSRIYDEGLVDQIINEVQNIPCQIVEVDQKRKKIYAPNLYDLTELQRDANKKYGFSAKKTLNLMQKLYESHKVLTYPRTDSRFLSSDILPTIKDRLKTCGIGEYASVAGQIMKNPIKNISNFVNDAKVTDHHAIIPTEEVVILSNFTQDERKIYDLVVKRFLAVLMAPHVYEATVVTAQIGKHHFKAKGKTMIELGWHAVYDASYEDEGSEEAIREQVLPILKKGDALKVYGVKKTKGFTTPPAHYTEGTLLTAMENPSKHMSGGIGTVATRADIIEKLLNSFLIEKKGNALHITSKGRQLLELVPTELKSADLTARWELKLEDIASGKLKKEAFIQEIATYTKKIIAEIKSSDQVFKHDNLTREKCPDCEKFLLEVNGKKGKMRICSDRACGFRKSISVLTNARCPNCHKKLELRGEGQDKTFFCKCGHREKLSAFNKRKKEADNKGSHKDLKKFLEEQKQTIEPVSPLAEALAKLKIKD